MNRIRELRKKKQLTQAALGRVLHISQGMVSSYENEETPITAELISQMSEFFGVTSDYLLGRDVPTPAPAEPQLSDRDVARIARQVAQLNRDPQDGEDDDVWAIREHLRRDPSYRLLFDAADKATPEHLRAAAAVLKALGGEENED